jgi:hypothetical protein
MSQQLFPETPGDLIASICNANFGELYAAKTSDAAAILALQSAVTTLQGAGTPFNVTANLTSAAAATPVHILPAASVTAGKKAYVTAVFLSVGGGTAWTDVTATAVMLQDTAGTPIVGATWLKALLTGNATPLTPSSFGSAMATGFTAAKGLDIAADANFAAGSTITVRVFGYIL